MRASGWDINGDIFNSFPIVLFSKETLLRCARRRRRSALDVPTICFFKSKHVATSRTLPGHATFQKVTPKVVPKRPQRVQIAPKMTPRDIPKLPRRPPASFQGRRKAPQSPHVRKHHACQQKKHPSRRQLSSLGPSAPCPLTSCKQRNHYLLGSDLLVSRSPARRGPSGVGGLKRPAASAADPE